MRDAAPTILLLIAVAVALLPAASALPLDVPADADAHVDASAEARLDDGALPKEIPLASVLDAPVEALATPLDVDVAAKAEAEADAVGPAPGAAIVSPSFLHPSAAPAEPASQAGGDDLPSLAAAGASLAVAAVGLTLGGLALRFLPGLLPAGLFSRIDRSQLLDNPVRARVHDAVANEPGLTPSDVQARAGIAWGTTVHHLRRLEANGLIVSVSQRAHRRYFLANTPAAAQRVPLSAILHPTARRIATLVAAQDGIGRSGLCAALALNGPSASKHIEQLRRHGLVVSERDGRRTRHHATSHLHAALELLGGQAPGVPAAPHMSVRLAGLSLTAA